jgi:hypothetical protein
LVSVAVVLKWFQNRGDLSGTGALGILVPVIMAIAMAVYVYFPTKGAKNAFVWLCSTTTVSLCVAWSFLFS